MKSNFPWLSMQPKRHQRITHRRAQHAVATGRDHHVLAAIGQDVGHGRGVAACGQSGLPQLRTGVGGECPQVAVSGRADKGQAAGGDQRAAASPHRVYPAGVPRARQSLATPRRPGVSAQSWVASRVAGSATVGVAGVSLPQAVSRVAQASAARRTLGDGS